MLHLLIGIENHLVRCIIDETYGQSGPQLTAASLVKRTATQTCAKQVQFGLAHRSFETE
jgi:hypothetical protein